MKFPCTIDLETFAIEARPNYPPKPVGVSIKYPGSAARYWAFGHPTNNNCTIDEAKQALREAWAWEGGLLFHNSKFDVDVAEVHMGLPRLPWTSYHDTMFEVFLHNPHAKSFALKPSAEALLGMPSEERNKVRDWLVNHGHVPRNAKDWGAFIAYAPGDLVGEYAIGDVVRTERLHRKLLPELKRNGMAHALDVERELMLVLLENERRGIPVAQSLGGDVAYYQKYQAKIDGWLKRKLGATKINLDSAEELIIYLTAAGLLDPTRLGLTPTGLQKTDKESLSRAVTDPVISAILNYRASLKTCIGTFMAPWLRQAELTGGRIHTSWSQTKNFEKGRPTGAVTGRLSSSPNFQNIPNEFPILFKHEASRKMETLSRGSDEYVKLKELREQLPQAPFILPPLPLVRSYLVPEQGHLLLDRDYSQQELRILATYAGGELLDTYHADPRVDIHDLVKDRLTSALGFSITRKATKTINFGLIYGMGVALMAQKAGISEDEARAIKEGVLALYPGIRSITQTMRQLAADGQPLRTWGGRLYHCEPPSIVDGELRTFEYKMINVLVQGSAADCTKEAILRYSRAQPPGHHLMLTVHDEILLSVPADEVEMGNEVLRNAMESVEFDIPMLSDGKTSSTNWSEMK